uniref:Uncharacterized protein n=1 Tax=Nelumbo nucifera TaxID=4432 RepID=A0A822XU26_NELNU|nr:TPA_asm: hypothetical protein HUJ06_024965 [Nelumbo nucifera]
MQEEMLRLQSTLAQLQETLATLTSNCPSPSANQVGAPVFSIGVNRQSSTSSHIAPSPKVVSAPPILGSTHKNNAQARNLEVSMPKRRKNYE